MQTRDLTLRVGETVGGGLQRWHVEVAYNLQVGGFQVTVSDRRGVPVRLETEVGPVGSVTDKRANALGACDLHVGAKVMLLGKAVTLMQVESLTGGRFQPHVLL